MNYFQYIKWNRSGLKAKVASRHMRGKYNNDPQDLSSTVHQNLSAKGIMSNCSVRRHTCSQTSKRSQAELYRCRRRCREKGMGASTCGPNWTKRHRQAPTLLLRWGPLRSRDAVLRSLLGGRSVPSDTPFWLLWRFPLMPCAIPLLRPQINTTSWSW
jgi:hypothetical protein